MVILENGLVPVYENERKERVVNARELHELLGSKREFATWIKSRIDKYGFLEDQDFVRFDNFVKGDENGFGNKKTIEYLLRIDTAKEIAMVENNDMGRKVRKYFIEIEKKYREQNFVPAMSIEDLIILQAQSMKEVKEKLGQVENDIKLITERINNFDNVDIGGDKQQQLVSMIRKFAFKKGEPIPHAWIDFKASFNVAYKCSLVHLITRYVKKNNLDKRPTMPEYLKLVNRLEDGIRVADKMLSS